MKVTKSAPTSLAMMPRARAPSVPPGPRSGRILGHLADIRHDPLNFFLQSASDHGGLVRIRAAHLHVFLVSEPEFIKRVLLDNMRNYVKGTSYASLRYLLGDGLLVAEGDDWRRQRRLMQPAFARQALLDKVPGMISCVAALCERWEERAASGDAFDLGPEMMRLALDVVGHTLFGSDIQVEGEAVEEVLPEVTKWVYAHLQSPFKLPPSLPTPRNRRYKRAVNVLDNVVARVVEKRRADPGAQDVLAMLINARDEETGKGIDDKKLRDEVLTLLLAGHETTGAALCWTLMLLAAHPEVERGLHSEVDLVIGQRAPTAEDYAALAFTGRIIDESMRLYPPAWSFTRTAVEEDHLGPYRIPKGATLIVSTYVNHRLPRFWEDAERFVPDRFLPERVKSQGLFHYFPFGGGPHLCIGKFMTLYEVRFALAMIAQRFRVRRVDDEAVTLDPNISLRPGSPIRVRVERRASAVRGAA